METKEICDHICGEVKQRFASTYHLMASKLFYDSNLLLIKNIYKFLKSK